MILHQQRTDVFSYNHQVDDGPEVPCGSVTGQLATSGLADGQHRVTIRSVKNGSGTPVAVKNVFFVVGKSVKHDKAAT